MNSPAALNDHEQLRNQRIGRASREISSDLVSALRRRSRLARIALPLRLADELLDDLERLNLTGRRRVPLAWEARIARLLAAIPGDVCPLPELRTNVLATRLMDGIYELEDGLLDLKLGPIRAELRTLDGELFEDDDEPVAGDGSWAVA